MQGRPAWGTGPHAGWVATITLGGLAFGHCAWAHPQLSHRAQPEGHQRHGGTTWADVNVILPSPEAYAGQSSSPRHPVVTLSSLSRGPTPRPRARAQVHRSWVTMVWLQKHVLSARACRCRHVKTFLTGSWLVKGCPGGWLWEGLPDLDHLWALQGCPGAQGDRLVPWAVRGDRLAP